MEGALGERLKREYGLQFDEQVAMAALVRSSDGRRALSALWREYAAIARQADILISAAGVLTSLTKDYVRPGQVVIDVSINWDANKPNAKGGLGGIAGDAKFDEVEPIVEAITPVPGGVGSVTTSVLMKHVVEAAEKV